MFLVDAVIPASGIGKRMGAAIPKQYLKIKELTILEHTYRALRKCSYIDKIILAISPEDQFFKNLSLINDTKVLTTYGGQERYDSVRNALALVQQEFVLVHDAVRPLVNREDLNSLITTVQRHPQVGAILATKATDTLKKAYNNSSSIEATIDRELIYQAQTPQMFKKELLQKALAYCKDNGLKITDDASAMEYIGYHPQLVIAKYPNLKITTPQDLVIAEALLNIKSEG